MTAPVSRPLPASDAVCSECGHDGAEHQHAGNACWAHMPRGRRADGTTGPVRLCDCARFVLDEPAHAATRHRYRVTHDLELPPLGGVS